MMIVTSRVAKLGKVVVAGVAVGPEIKPYWPALYQQTELHILEENSPQALQRAITDADVLILRPVMSVPRSVFESAPNLRGIVMWGVGYDSVDVVAATARGLPVITLPVFLNSIAEAVFCFLFEITKKYERLNHLARSGERPTLEDRSETLEGKTLGCVGFGRIGQRVARAALVFDMEVLVTDPYLNEARVGPQTLPLVPLEQLLSRSHFVSLHAPLTPATRHMINARALASMRADAYLINIARGGLVDEAALYKALVSGQIAGAALDVFEQEPVSPDNPLLGLDNVWATPHYLGATWEGLGQLASAAQDATLRLLRGEHPGYTVINPEVFGGHHDH